MKSDGTVMAWGINNGDQTTIPAGLTGVTAIAAGYSHSVALKGNGTVVAWGYNAFGQTTIPAGLTGVTAIAAGHNHTVALKSDGTVAAWGYNILGQTTIPSGLTGVTAIAAGYQHNVALKSDGTLVGWGSNGQGQTSIAAGLNLFSHTVTPSAGAHGALTDSTPQVIMSGTSVSFTVTPDSGYTTDAVVGGTCATGLWSGSTYTTGAVATDCTLSFSFTINSYQVTYGGNGHSGGDVPVDGSGYDYDTSVSVLGNSGALSKNGHVFVGWNTAADGSGSRYAVGATFVISDATTLYAQWASMLADTDMDGMNDGWEVNNGLNPLVDDAALDKDGDGYSNLHEYEAGTSPNDSDDMPVSRGGAWRHAIPGMR